MNVATRKIKQRPSHQTTALDPQWYRDATIYQLHVKSFQDSNGDGIGDLPGLISRLDYIAELGADTIWLLPFYPSPLRDDGYDISDYRGVNPDYGTMADFRRFIAAAHARGLRVITELVINHTSDQHPWFQRARAAKPGSAARDYYVWSDTDQAYAGTRIIFVDSEKSNWTWDAEAGAYFWHRFYSHQPDLNFDNPKVLEEVLSIMRFWLDTGVDGLRLDAVPYLVEREGTNNENLPETHAILKRIRAEMDAYAPGKMLLAEANQWPEDAQQYFGDGDECNMSFHFPLMPRMYMAIAQEDRFPITDIMRQTPDIPESCQWVVFLRNHDELTLEMVTDSERDYLWNTYAADRRARINLGIRRRLAPLLERDRRRMELMTSLLLSMPGTPVIYYGDEIGMGDNIHLGDRDGVRTPMQWSPDRNGGFSRAAPEALVLPPIMDPVYGYASVNVEAQDTDQHSPLNWTRRMLAIRRRQKAFGRGSQRFLAPTNRKILAFVRVFEDTIILCASNLSRTAQAIELDLAEYAGRVPVDLLGGSAFPPVGQLPYQLTFPPYAFYWFVLASDTALPSWHIPTPETMPEYATLVVRQGVKDILSPATRLRLETEIVPKYLGLRRWFASKNETVRSVKLARTALLGNGTVMLAEFDVQLDKRIDTYLLPLEITWDDVTTSALEQQLALARVRQVRRTGLLTDAFTLDTLAHAVLDGLRENQVLAVDDGEVRFISTPRLADVAIAADAPIRRLSAEQSNSSQIIGNAAMLKVLRRVNTGVHPEIEMSNHLTKVGYANTPPLLGSVWRVLPNGEQQALIVVQGFVFNQGDGWQWTQDTLAKSIETLISGSEPHLDETHGIAPYVTFAATVGRRLGELHAALAEPSDDPAFAPEEATEADAVEWAADVARQFGNAVSALRATTTWPDASTAEDAAYLMDNHDALLARIDELAKAVPSATKMRIHGDFHLGQMIVAVDDVYLIDFEGEPARPLAERRAKYSPLRDVAGMIRSFDYARAMATNGLVPQTLRISERIAPFLQHAHQEAVTAFLDAYRAVHTAAPQRWADAEAEAPLLDLFLLQKASYEISYEAANRVSWLPVPLGGLAAIARRLAGGGTPSPV
jgi:maltose alpha-D-glucosyltransferase/alpha-amylase